jgi:hypothetical protein
MLVIEYVTCASEIGIISAALFLRKIKIKKMSEIVETVFKFIFSKQWA